jgi:pilus assembly protein CpaC
MTPRVKKFKGLLTALIIVILVAAPQAQQAQPPGFATGAAVTAPPPLPDMPAAADIDLLVGRSTILNVGTAITRVSLTVPDVADAMVTAPTQLLIHGKQPGTISMFVWDRSGAIKTYEVNVRRDLTALTAYLKQLFPGENISVIGSGKDVVISGTVTSKYVIEKAADVAGGYVEKKENVVNLLKQQEGVASNQVMLRVRFAEVSRSAMQELGASAFAHGFKSEWSGRVAPPGVPSPDFDADKGLVFSDFLNLFVFNHKEGLGAVVRALSNKGLFQSLAEPNLIATNGKEASFLAGGEYPYPVVQSGSGSNSVTIMFKEFGVRLSFTPTVLGGDLVHLKVKPEVSSLDFANAVSIDGFRVPALSTRRTETEVELRDGQTFAIAGLMNNTLTSTLSKIPGIGDIPIIGHLFRSKAHQKNQTELVVMITPTIIRKGQMGVSEGLPSLIEPYLGAPNKTHPNPDAYVGSPRYPVTEGRPSSSNPAPAATGPVAPVNVHPAAATTSAETKAEQTTPAESRMEPTKAAPAAAPKAPVAQAPAAAPALTKDQLKALAKQREQQQKAEEAAAKKREEDARRKAAADKEAAKKAEEAAKAAEKLEKERAKREAEVAKKNEEIARKQAEEDLKRDRALAEAAARLQEAQNAYQAEVQKAKGSSDEKPKGSGGTR